MDARSIRELDWWRTPLFITITARFGVRWGRWGGWRSLARSTNTSKRRHRRRLLRRRRGSNIIHARVGARQRLASQLHNSSFVLDGQDANSWLLLVQFPFPLFLHFFSLSLSSLYSIATGSARFSPFRSVPFTPENIPAGRLYVHIHTHPNIHTYMRTLDKNKAAGIPSRHRWIELEAAHLHQQLYNDIYLFWCKNARYSPLSIVCLALLFLKKSTVLHDG